MHRARFFLLFAVSLLPLVPSNAQTSATGSIRGVVLRSADNAPVSDAVVHIASRDESESVEGGEAKTTTTAADGSFAYEHLSPGKYMVSVEARNYVQLWGTTSGYETVNVAPGQSVAGVRLIVTSPGVVTGKVTDENGGAMMGAAVMVLKPILQGGKRSFVPADEETTNDLGEYRIFRLSPGTYYLAASGQPSGYSSGMVTMRWMEPANDASHKKYPLTFYPGTTDASQAVPLRVVSGQEVSADFRLAPVHAVTVRGRVSGVKTKDATVMVELAPRQPKLLAMPAITQADKNGNFTFDEILPGDYVLAALINGDSKVKDMVSGRSDLRVGDTDLTGVELPMRILNLSLRGRLMLDGTPPRDLGSLRIDLSPVNGDFSDILTSTTTPAAISKNGSFELQFPSDQRYLPIITTGGTGWEDWYLDAIRCGSQDYSKTGFRPGSCGSGALELVLHGDGATVSGTVLDANKKPVPHAEVVLIPPPEWRDRLDLYQPTATDFNGHFEIRGARPGNYQVLAVSHEDGESGAFTDNDFLRQHEGEAVSISLEPKQKKQVQLLVAGTTDNN